ncbi:MAG: hypothetical protein J7L37_02735 [Thermococcus sp.]|nr:hypothetical protein [Thermococcus sp.]
MKMARNTGNQSKKKVKKELQALTKPCAGKILGAWGRQPPGVLKKSGVVG